MASLPSTSSMETPSGKWIDRLFLRLGTIYGALWTDKWRDAPVDLVKAEWERVLSGFSMEALRGGLDHCAASLKFPPSLPEFAQACRDARPRPEAQVRRPLLVDKPAADFVARKIAEMKMVTNKWRE